MRRGPTPSATVAAVAVAGHVVLAWPSLALTELAANIAPIWLPSGLAFALAVWAGLWTLPFSAAGAFLANLLLGGEAVSTSALFAAASAVDPGVGAAVYRWLSDPPRVLWPRLSWRVFTWRDGDAAVLTTERDALALWLAALVGGAASAACLLPAGFGLANAAAWMAGAATGIAILGPPLLIVAEGGWAAPRARPVETLAGLGLVALTHHALFVVPVAWSDPVIALAAAPALVWAPMQLGRIAAGAIPGLAAAFAVAGTVFNRGAFAELGDWSVPSGYLLAAALLAWVMGARAETRWGARATREARRRAAETARDRLMELLESTSDFVLTGQLTADGTDIAPVYVNAGAWRLLGADEHGELGALTLDTIHPPWAARLVREHALPVAERDGVWHGETAVRHAKGHEVPVSQVVVPHRDRHGAVRAISTIIRDISAAKETERALRREKAFTDHVVATSPNLVVSLTPEAEVRFVNPAVERATGYPREALVGAPWWPTLFPHDPDGAVAAARERLARDDEVTDHTLTLTTRAGDTRIVRWTFMRRRGADGRPIEVVAHGRDITAEREEIARQQQEEKLRALGELAGGMAHELNNALQPIVGLMGVVRERAGADDAVVESCLNKIEDHTLHARTIVTDVLAFARQQGPDVATFELRALLAEAVGFARSMVVESVTFELEGVGADAPGPALPARVSRNGLIQVMQNIVNNAVDAMDGKGRIRIALGPSELDAAGRPRGAEIRVTDDGPGMDAVTARNLFNPFHTTKQVGAGSGLGMSVVYGLVTHWSGEIQADSTPGAGTTITIRLPCTHPTDLEPEMETT